MKFNIKECEVHGVLKPLLLYSGWIESKVVELKIETNDETVIDLKFQPKKAKIHTFSIRQPLLENKKNAKYSVYAITNDGEKVEIDCFETTLKERIVFKLSTKKKKYKKITDKAHKKELNATLDMRDDKGYYQWIEKYEKFTEVKNWDYQPLISIVMPVYNVDAKYLKVCIDSILNQTYKNFEICIADDCSTKEETIQTLKDYMQKDSRVKVIFREKNGHISEATNSALTLATGEFVGLMDNDDALMPQALNEVVAVLNENKDIDFIYSDEDKIDPDGKRSDPHFKPDFALEKLYGGNYICHFSVIRKTIIEEVGAFRKGYEGAQDFDLFIRIAEVTKKFYHIPKILYHWRMIPGSTAIDSGQKNYAGEAGKRALEDLFAKKGINTQVDIVISTHYFVQYILNYEPSVRAIMFVSKPTDELIERLYRMKENLSYQNYRWIFVTENVNELEHWILNVFEKEEFEILPLKEDAVITFNQIVSNINENILLYLDEKAELESFDGMDVLVGYAMQGHIGVVGTKVFNKYKHITDTGYFLINEKLLPVHYSTYYFDYGFYGNLLVPNNYRVVENKCFMLETNKAKQYRLSNEFETLCDAFAEMCLRLDKDQYKNVILPYVEVKVDSEITQDNYDLAKLTNRCKMQGINVEYDRYYNVNLSEHYGFRLDK